MNIYLLLAILGIIIAVVFGVLGIIFFLKRKFKGKLNLIIDESIGLYDSVVKNIEGLEIIYNNEPIKENMYLLKIFMINSGEMDLTKEMTEKYPCIGFGDNSKIHKTSIIGKSSELKVNIEVENNNIKIENGLIRREEYLYIEALIETNKGSKLDDISFHYRISEFDETQPIVKSNLSRTSKFILYLWTVVVGISINLIFILLGNYKIFINQVELSNADTQIKLSYVEYHSTFKEQKGVDRATLKEIKTKAKFIQDNYDYFDLIFKRKPTEFSIHNYNVKFVYDDTMVIFLTILAGILLISIIILIWNYFSRKQNRKLLKIIENAKNKNTQQPTVESIQ